MAHSDLVSLFLALGVVLGTARLLGELARLLNQPAVMGELFAGIVLGPTLLGALAPDVFDRIFPSTPGFGAAMQGLTVVAITLFLLVAGIEVDLSSIFRQGRLAFNVALGGIVLPFAVGFSTGWIAPIWFSTEALGVGSSSSPLVFALFLATTLSISALPVIAKTLMDLNLYRSELGMTVIAAAVLNDLIGWIVFAVLLGMMGTAAGAETHFPIGLTIGLTLAYVALMLTVGRSIMHRSLPFIQAHTSWPGGVLGFAVVIAMLGAAFTEWIGIHAIFGSFIVGVALGDSAHLKERTRQTLDSFVTFIFAPLFFATVGLKIDFLANFDWMLVLFVIVIACVGKLIGCGMAARWSGQPWRESWAIGAAMNARGAMEIILALLALEANLINERLFVALVIMALATSVIAGPIMQSILRRKKTHYFTDYLGSRSFIAKLNATDRFAAVKSLCLVSGATGLPMERVIGHAIAREQLLPTGIGNSIALSHVRLPDLDKPQVALAISRQGIDFDSPDGELCQTICLILTSEDDLGLGLELYRDAAATLLDKSLRKKLSSVNGYTEFLALLAEFRGLSVHDATTDKSVLARNGVLIVGANSTARALANLLKKSQPVTLIDNNAAHVEAAKRAGLIAILGNALDIEVLADANAHSAKFGLMMTANAEINAIAARQLREIFQVPKLAVVLEETGNYVNAERLKPLGAASLFGCSIPLNEWDHWFLQDAVRIDQIEVTSAGPLTVFSQREQGRSRLILAVERHGERDLLLPFTSEMEWQTGDILTVASVNTTENQTSDRFDLLVTASPILDLAQEMTRDEFFQLAAESIGGLSGESPAEIHASLLDRESQSSTVLTAGLAIPHITLKGSRQFSMLVARCPKGVQFGNDSDPITALFVLAGTADERNFHLKSLSAIVQISQATDFKSRWLAANDSDALRRLLLEAPRQRSYQ